MMESGSVPDPDPGRVVCGTRTDDHNHGLAALRDLVSRLNARLMARPRVAKPNLPPRKRDPWLGYDNEELWTRLF